MTEILDFIARYMAVFATGIAIGYAYGHVKGWQFAYREMLEDRSTGQKPP